MPGFFSREDRRDNLVDTALDLCVVGDAPSDRHLACTAGIDTLVDQFSGVDQDASARAFFQTVFSQNTNLPTQSGKQTGVFAVASRLVGDDLRFLFFVWKVKLESHKPLAGAVFEVFDRVLISGVVRHHQQKTVRGVDY